MPWTQPWTNRAFVHHPEATKHTNGSFGVITLTGIGRPTTGVEGMDGGAIMVPPCSPNGPFTTYPTVGGIPTMSGPTFANDAGFTLGDSQSVISQYGSHMEREATAGVYEGGPRHATSGALANEPSHEMPTATARRLGPRLPVEAEGDLTRLKEELVENGADVEAVNLCDEVFEDGINKGALQKRLTRKQCRRLHLQDGKQFQVFLEKVQVAGGTKNRCRLCPENNAALYKNHRDALRHFLKEHFGLCYECTRW